MLYSDRYSDRHIIVRPVRWAALVYASAILLIHLTEVDQHINSITSSATLAKLSIYSGFLGVFSVLLGVLLWDAMRTGGVRIVRIYSSVSFILVPFALITVLGLAFNFHPTAYWGEHGNSSLLPFWPLFSFLLLCSGVSFVAIPNMLRHYRTIFVLCFACITFTALLDFFSLAQLSVYGGRAAGFAGNPNLSAQLLIALSVASVDWRRPTLLNGVIWLVAGVGVFITLSRGGLLAYVFALSVYLAFTMRPQVKTLLSRFTVLAAILVLALVFGLASITPFLERNEMFSSPTAQYKLKEIDALLTGDFGSVASDERAGVAYEYMDRIAQSPWLGHGTGFTAGQTLGPHNIYLNQWVENGVLGLALLLAFLSASFWHFRRYKDMRGIMFVATFSIAGFFSHDLLHPLPFMVLFGFLGALACVERLEPIGPRSSSLPRG